ncbi:MAG: hypothetical protein H0X51_00260 [Parachlamydiaceae bacterium]|nr:hypothetical protein [Parachlamydiaceae bacterium]
MDSNLFSIDYISPLRKKLELYYDATETNWCGRSILFRGGKLGLAGLSVVCNSTDLLRGLIFGIGTLLTAGLHSNTYSRSMKYLSSSNYIAAETYLHLLSAVNPDYANSRDCLLSPDGHGIIAVVVDKHFRKFATKCNNSPNLFVNQVVCRLTYLSLILAQIICRVADGVLGVIGMAFSFMTIGKITFFNRLAFRGLQAPGLLRDIFYCTTKCLNPKAGVTRVYKGENNTTAAQIIEMS